MTRADEAFPSIRLVNIREISLLNNPARFDEQYNFRIKFEAIAPLAEDLEWRLIYVGSAKSEEYDQELDSCMVGPIPAGINAFDFSAPAPAHHLLPSLEPEEILGVTVIIITASYRDKEFVRVGYYVNTYYEEEELRENPPPNVQWEKLYRNVLIEKPKVTRFQNPWDSIIQSTPFDTPIPNEQIAQSDQNLSTEMFSAPLPPPVQKVVSGYDGSGGMEVDQEVVS
ncbi:histone chaperone ASF1 [Tremella mesenterica]|uniref:Anti-silencing function protein 1 n=1 Tax=Tremella mesenterica TaxID=5217 RepID=A0A4Q1BSB9_TREME|nr:histone chaperone ASF1 [Tremella mesenterica]